MVGKRSTRMRRLALLSIPLLAATAWGLSPSSPALLAHAAQCPAGFTAVPSLGGCLNNHHPESYGDYAIAASLGAAHDATTIAGVRLGAHAAGVDQSIAMSRRATRGTWHIASPGPLIANDPTYPRTSGEGFSKLSGRVNSFAYDKRHHTLYATVGQGGVWRSRDLGAHWTSIGNKLPSQPVGSVAYTRAGSRQGTIIVVTGNDTYGGGTGSYGLGVWFSRNGGSTWHHSKGVPSEALGFRAAVNPVKPKIVYAATGAGLYRSTDAGAHFKNVNLPTGYTDGNPKKAPLKPNCTGKFRTPGCFLANVVTDVTVQGAANKQTPNGHPGSVMAIVAWRAGDKKNPNGNYVESPNNGVYVSPSGKPGTFHRINTDSSLGDTSQIGRTEFGAATGAQQNHKVVYAEVADAQAFQNSDQYGIDTPASSPTGSNTYFRGIFVSTDWGKTWKQLASASQLTGDPSSGSSLTGVGCQAESYCPGVQAWYNEWIQPDPTRTGSNGVPSRLMFGLEEVWDNDPSTSTLDGSSPVKFHVVGRYFGGTTCQFFDFGLPNCPTNGPDQSKTTLHPDQHAGLFIPDSQGGKGVTVLAGNDGGVYKQHVAAGADLTSGGWGAGLQTGFNTLMPYDAAIANDGTIVAGLQDNGEEKISPGGTSNEIFDGDGFYTAIDPKNSGVIYEEYAYGQMNVSTDGGRNWTEIHASDSGSQFAMPFSMDATDANHFIAGGGTDPNNPVSDEFVEETTSGSNTTEPGTGGSLPTDWVNVFDLGSSGNNPNSISATATRGNASYVGYCGACQVLTQTPFKRGIATNVGGSVPGKKASTAGWHFAKAKGLPNRYVSWVEIDPRNPKTVYVALASYSRRWTPPGVLGESPLHLGTGHVFVSHDAGNSFRNISGNLPDVPANAIVTHGHRLVVGTDVGVYISSSVTGTSKVTWRQLGHGLPAGVQVISLRVKNNNSKVIIAATHGRGVYKFKFPT